MSRPTDPNSPAPKEPDERPADFGAGAFEGQAAREERSEPAAISDGKTEPILLESAPPPLVIELPAPSAIVETPPVPAVPITEAPPPVPTAPIEPRVTERSRQEPVAPAPAFASEARPRAHEVEAVPVSRYDAPAPTIDVEARRVPPPPPARPPEPVAPAASRAHETAAPMSADASAAAAGSAPHAAPPVHAAPSPHAAPSQAAPPPRTAPPVAASADGAASRWWSMFCHLFLFLAIPTLFLGGLLTLLVWQLAGRNDALVTDHGREALNFQINVAILTALLAISCIASPLIPVVWFVAGVFCILAAVRAFSGATYRYPYMLRIVRA